MTGCGNITERVVTSAKETLK
eukprot:COSAG04_NODE_9960_length_817_cov_1.000000_2_plen_20_part_01